MAMYAANNVCHIVAPCASDKFKWCFWKPKLCNPLYNQNEWQKISNSWNTTNKIEGEWMNQSNCDHKKSADKQALIP